MPSFCRTPRAWSSAGHSPAAGLLILALAALFGGLIAWAGLTEIEQVVRAQGQVEPAGRVKVVNHPDGGRIAGIHVAEGDTIAAGEPLVTFDGELVQTELAELTGRWQVKAAEAARLRAEASGEEPVFEPELAAGAPGPGRASSASCSRRAGPPMPAAPRRCSRPPSGAAASSNRSRPS